MRKKRVLVVEDDFKVFNMLKNTLDSSSFEIIRVRAVDQAVGAVEEEDPFDCYVVDLSILASGLTLEEMAKFQNREGYAFLKNYLWKGTEEEVKELKNKTIICSRYTKEFEKELRGRIDDLQMILKDKGFEEKLARKIEKICQ